MSTNGQDAALEGAETGTMSFPQGVALLMQAGPDGSAADFRRATRSDDLPNGETHTEVFPGTQP